MSTPLPRHIKQRGSKLCAWFRHPMLPNRGPCRRSLGLRLDQIEEAQRISDQLSELIKDKRWHSKDQMPTALAQFPDAAPIFYGFLGVDDGFDSEPAQRTEVIWSDLEDDAMIDKVLPLAEGIRRSRIEAAEARQALQEERKQSAQLQKALSEVTAERDGLQRRLIETQAVVGQPDMPITEAQEQYIAWGKARGGRGGRAWSRVHAYGTERRLREMLEACEVEKVGDLENGLLPKVESALADMTDLSAKSKFHAITALRGFINWLRKRELMGADPLRHLGRIDATPETERRSLTLDELKRLLAVAPPERQLLWSVAACTGLRRNELFELTEKHLTTKGLRLEARWTKNRKEAIQPLPAALIERLLASRKAGLPERLYAENPTTIKHWQTPDKPLLFVTFHWYRRFRVDLEAAGINTDGLSPHCLRHTFVSLLLEAGAAPKDVMELARHASPAMTMGIYAHTTAERLASVTDKLGASLLS